MVQLPGLLLSRLNPPLQFCVIELHNLVTVECLLPARMFVLLFLTTVPMQDTLLFTPFLNRVSED